MYCSKCGSKNSDDVMFCIECGEKVSQNSETNSNSERVDGGPIIKSIKHTPKFITKITISLILVVVGIGSYFVYLAKQEAIVIELEKQKTEELHYQFAVDVVRTLFEVKESEGKMRNSDNTENEFTESAFIMKENVNDAIKIMQNWESSEDNSVNTITKNLLDGLEDLSDASDIFVEIAQGTSKTPETDTVLFGVKLEEGRKVVSTVPLGVALRLSLSEQRKADLISYIDRLFEEEIENQRKFSEEGDDYVMPQYAWGVIILRNALIKASDMD